MTTVAYYAERDGRDYITPEDITAAIDAGAEKSALQQEVLEWLGKRAAEDWSLCAFVAAKFEKSEYYERDNNERILDVR